MRWRWNSGPPAFPTRRSSPAWWPTRRGSRRGRWTPGRGGFDSWDVCDQVCGSAFLASPLAWPKVLEWAGRPEEFVRRAAFALLATLAVHDKAASNAPFIAALPLIEAAAGDERNFVKKAVNWALRNIGKRNAALNQAAIDAARRIQATGLPLGALDCRRRPARTRQ